jgi:hypothetical protein
VDSIPPVQNADLIPPSAKPERITGYSSLFATYIRGYFRKYSTRAECTNRGFLQGIYQMPHFNSHSVQIVPDKNTAKRALNIRGEVIVLFHLPPESLSPQKTKSPDQTSKEVPRGKMGRLVEAITQ